MKAKMRALLDLFLLSVGNIGRRLTEWADRHSDRGDKHVIDLMREAWGLEPTSPKAESR